MEKNIKKTILSNFLEPLLINIADKQLPYCICGNYKYLPYYTENDVDIWTKTPKLLIQIIEDICIQQKIQIYLINNNATGTNIFGWVNTYHGPITIHLDILSECRWCAILPLVKSKVIENNRKMYKNFYVANETVDAAMHLMYPLSHFGYVTKKYHCDIKNASTENTFWDIIRDGWGNSFSKRIKPLVECNEWAILEQVFSQNRYRLIWNSIRNMRWAEFSSFFPFLFYNFQRLYKPSGLFIAFVGPDGCGKTTVQTNLEPFFTKGFTKGKIKKFYWRPFLFPRIKTLLSGGVGGIEKTSEDNPSDRLELRKVGFAKKLLHCVKLTYYWLDYILGRIKYQNVWSRGGVVCFDRYWDDLLVFPERFGLNVPKWIVRFLGLFIPKPDIIFYLHAEPDVLTGRKPELPLDEMKAQIEHYKNLSYLNGNYELIDGNKSQAEVLTSVIQACLKNMSKRYLKKK